MDLCLVQGTQVGTPDSQIMCMYPKQAEDQEGTYDVIPAVTLGPIHTFSQKHGNQEWIVTLPLPYEHAEALRIWTADSCINQETRASAARSCASFDQREGRQRTARADIV
eukprot:m.118008 g.118008  ORF g.118008 m.118008 type:complete len:110 (+) comp19491_c0_seq4:511-840(+)